VPPLLILYYLLRIEKVLLYKLLNTKTNYLLQNFCLPPPLKSARGTSNPFSNLHIFPFKNSD